MGIHVRLFHNMILSPRADNILLHRLAIVAMFSDVSSKPTAHRPYLSGKCIILQVPLCTFNPLNNLLQQPHISLCLLQRLAL